MRERRVVKVLSESCGRNQRGRGDGIQWWCLNDYFTSTAVAGASSSGDA